jgi:hypothetical protein
MIFSVSLGVLLNWKFVARGLALAIGALAVMLVGLYLALPWLFLRIPYGPTPPPPEIAEPAGSLPVQWPGLETWAVYPARDPRLAGSGFFLRLPDGVTVYVSAAHAFDLSSDLHAIEVGADPLVLTALYGEPGVPRLFGSDLRVDYILFATEGSASGTTEGSASGTTEGSASGTTGTERPGAVGGGPDPDLVGEPDARGAPQPGERLVLYPGVADSRRPLIGTVLSVEARAVWVIMDDAFDAGLMSGSPFFSEHTGRIVGMALVSGEKQGHTVIGLHPIGSLVEIGMNASSITPLSEYEG